MSKIKYFLALILTILVGLLAACQPAETPLPQTADNIIITQQPLESQRLCSGTFFPHYLNHVTSNQYEPIDMFDSNGTGVAANDLDQDGDIDLVFANLAGDNQIFWNNGRYSFTAVPFPHGSSRAVATIDVDSDGLLDIVFTSRVGSLLYWRNTGDASTFPFEKETLVGVTEQAYSMNWGDLDQDGDLDLVTGSYDSALEKELRDSFLMGNGAGVFVYENIGGGKFIIQERLAEDAQALAIALMDLNDDGRDDILIGNDFGAVRDQYFLATADGGWAQVEPFTITTQNTMSFDMGDINNDGLTELFAADMHPYKFDEAENEAWAPVMEMMMDEPAADDPQRMENVLQTPNGDGTFSNIAYDNGVAYSGWSWSSRFGDLDHDGYLDLYIVNGMATAETFAHMPNYELVEENQVFRNDGTGMFQAMTDKWNLGATDGGRGMTMADMDQDGDLDIIINNLLSEAIIYENRICSGNQLVVELREDPTQSDNPFAIGSQVILETSAGTQTRQVDSVAGYLSSPPAQLHFGIPDGVQILSLTVIWPDGAQTAVEQITPNYQLSLTR